MAKNEFNSDHPNIHPACDLFPMLDEHELWHLAQGIKQNGLTDPIVVHQGQLIDGRNRLAACKLVSVEPKFEEWSGKGSITQWIISKNLQRRHLTASQRAVVGFELLPLLENEAKERQRLSRGRGKKGEQVSSTELGKASEHAADTVNCSSTYIEQVKRIQATAPELLQEVKHGVMTVDNALTLSKLPPRFRQEVLEQAESTTKKVPKLIRQAEIKHREQERKAEQYSVVLPSDSDVQVWTGDCLELMKIIEPKSVDVAVTSVPYNIGVKYDSYDDNMDDEDYLFWIDTVLDAIKTVLKDDGSFFLNIGVIPKKQWLHLAIMQSASLKFCIQNSIVWAKSVTIDEKSVGQFRPVRSQRYLTPTHEHILHLTKNGDVELDRLSIGVPYSDETGKFRFKEYEDIRCGGTVWVIPHESTKSRADKWSHPCPFPVELAERCLKLHGVKEGMVALDPFNGVGSSTVAMTRLGIKGIGVDIDEAYCQIAKARILEEQKRLEELAKTIKAKRIKTQDEFNEELAIILEECMELGGQFTRDFIHNLLSGCELFGVTEFEAAVASLPTELKDYYLSLTSEMAA